MTIGGKFLYSRSFGGGRVYTYHYPHYGAVERVKKYLRRPGSCLTREPTGKGKQGLWVGKGLLRKVQPRTVKALLQIGWAEQEGNIVRRKRS